MKKGTFQPNNRRKNKKHGFFSRMKSGIINKRRSKGRKHLSDVPMVLQAKVEAELKAILEVEELPEELL